MFTSLTSYLWGSSEVTEEEPAAERPLSPNLKTSPTETDDWVLVDKSSREASLERLQQRLSPMTSSMNSDNGCFAQMSPPQTPGRRRNASNSCSSSPRDGTTSDSGSDISTLPEVSHTTESWLVTPPPCFTAGGNSPQRLETSSMENLLIEHPSMSVYGARHRQSSTGHESDQSQSSTSSTDNVPPSTVRHTVTHAPRRPRAVAARAGMLAQSAKAAQVGQYKYQTRQLSRSALERRNRLSYCGPATKRSRVYGNMKQPAARSVSKRC